jgi:hypothetical protein
MDKNLDEGLNTKYWLTGVDEIIIDARLFSIPLVQLGKLGGRP